VASEEIEQKSVPAGTRDLRVRVPGRAQLLCGSHLFLFSFLNSSGV
jgi:hypothetical protein